MADQIRWATELLEPLWLFLMKQVLLSTVMHVDATSLPVRDKDAVGGITLGSLWGYVGDPSAAVYLYTRTGKKVGQVEGGTGRRRVGFTTGASGCVSACPVGRVGCCLSPSWSVGRRAWSSASLGGWCW